MSANTGRRRKTLIIVASVVGGLAAVAVVVVLFVGLVLGRSIDPKPGDEDHVITASTFAEMFDPELEVSAANESLRRTEYLDGTYDIEYEYESPDGTVYMNVHCFHEHSDSDARAVYAGLSATTRVLLGVLGEGIELEDAPHIYRLGDDHKSGWLMYEGRRTGVAVTARHGDAVLYFLFAGYELADDHVMTLLEPVAAHL